MADLARSGSLTNYADIARKVGLDPYRLLSEFGLPQRCLREPELKVPMEAVRRLLEASAERSGVRAFGLLMAETRRLSNLGPLGMLARDKPTLRAALEALTHYTNRLNEALFLTMEEADDVVVLRPQLVLGSSAPVRQATELAIGVAFRTLQALQGEGWKPRRVCFTHDAPVDRSVHDRVFGRIVEFGQDFNGIVWSRKDLDLRNPNADPLMAHYAEGLVEASYASKAPNMTSQVRGAVVALLGTGNCTMDLAVQRLGIPRRTLHRHLSQEGSTFSDIVEAVRRELAARYVADKQHSLTDISTLLGFSAPSAFSRWYRRQFNTTASKRRVTSSRRTR